MKAGTRKKRPRSIAVFGATGHIGRPLADQVRYRAQDVSLRLITSVNARKASLAAAFPDSECLVASFFDPPSLERALEDVEGVFVVTPSPFDEAVAMKNLVEAVQKVARPVHIVRITGFEPESLPRRVPESVRRFGGTAQQHYVAKRILDESDLPVTYLNVGASYMDNFLVMAQTVQSQRKMIWPERLISYIDPRDLGEVAANLLLSCDERHIYQFHTVNNGQDLLTVGEIAQMLSDILKVGITHDESRQAFVEEYGVRLAMRRGVKDAAEQILDFIAYEQGNAAFHALNDFAERMLGRRPTSLRAWFMEHRQHFCG